MYNIEDSETYDWDSVVVSPNLGHPKILQIDKELNNKVLQINLLFVSDINDPKEFERSIGEIRLVPILEYKWKMKIILEERKKYLKKKRKKEGFWSRFKLKRKKKEKSPKSSKTSKSKLKKVFQMAEERLRRLKPRAFRGDKIIPLILEVNPVDVKTIIDLDYDEFCSPQNYLNKNNVYKSLMTYYKVFIEYSLTEEVLEFLKRRNFVMFDINQKSEKGKKRINYHSIVVSKQEWKNFNFVHATDLHLAERNDKIYEIIKKWTKFLTRDDQERYMEEQKKELEKLENDEDNLFLPHFSKPLKRRLVNPNNQMRKFIKIMNKKVLQNDLDFIALTGDLVDFAVLSKLPKEDRVYDYNHSNWKIFKEIVLNLPQKKRRGMDRGEELLCPIFTITGNHDYRPFHYDLRWAGLYRKIGLKAIEALALNDKLVAFPITAIMKSSRALNGYLSEINPSLDYSFKLGNSNFIFLNTGSDSFKHFADLISGHPSLTGLTNIQIKYLENLINHRIQKDDNTFLFLHGPVINPKRKIGFFKKFKRKFKRKLGKLLLTKIDEFRESILSKFEKKPSKIRIDGKFNVKYGTVSSNWEKLITFCKDHCILTMTGHTHALKEFRLDNPDDFKSTVFDAPPFNLKKIENPAAIFYDTYSELYTNAEDIEKYAPFVVQTPALGLGGFRDPKLTGAYREVKVENGKLSSFEVKYLHRFGLLL
ncbi:MAG: metallophosphoesterase family protein [Promethearchaeota archaeon]